jgi:hypothetical protein
MSTALRLLSVQRTHGAGSCEGEVPSTTDDLNWLDPSTKLVYVGSHNDGKKTLAFNAVVTHKEYHPANKWTATVVFEGCEGETPEKALKRLGEWCARAAKALKARRPKGSLRIPL